jgi:hypothetical protein
VTPPFRVSYSGAVRAQLRLLVEEAAQQDRNFAVAVLAAAKPIDARLRAGPRDFGDPHFTLQGLELDIRVAVIQPLAVTYAVHQQEAIVLVQRFTLLSPPPTVSG